MDLGLRGKTAIVTGGGSNIGRAIALTLAHEGANVIIAELDEKQGQVVTQEIATRDGNAICTKTDVTSLQSVTAMFEKAVSTFGQVHILVNVVGGDKPQYFLETDPQFWDWVINLNYRSDLNTLKTVLPHMVENGYGRIVNIASDAGRMGEPREAVYAGCKAGVIALSKAIAREVGRNNITVNAICPGVTIPQEDAEIGALSTWSKSEVTVAYRDPEVQQKVARNLPLRRLTKAQDIANAVAFMVSDAAGYITGQTLSVSGGYTMM
ncbi:MAG: SDR family oxidoreductase [Chloroflexota bacterium]|nr:MAG: SDR family oxidoreductase [Chloroflexota bacterium]